MFICAAKWHVAHALPCGRVTWSSDMVKGCWSGHALHISQSRFRLAGSFAGQAAVCVRGAWPCVVAASPCVTAHALVVVDWLAGVS
eukprot:6339751-Alexandrium_andersonii.AAC.1